MYWSFHKVIFDSKYVVLKRKPTYHTGQVHGLSLLSMLAVGALSYTPPESLACWKGFELGILIEEEGSEQLTC
jgi:hypothetical protein